MANKIFSTDNTTATKSLNVNEDPAGAGPFVGIGTLNPTHNLEVVGTMSVSGNFSTNRPYWYLPDGWNTVWEAAKTNAASAFSSLLFLGDSVMDGASCGDVGTLGFKDLVRASLIARGLPLGGDFIHPGDTVGYVSTPNPFTVSASGLTNGFNGFQRSPQYVGASVGTVTFISRYACTDIDILYYVGAAGTWTYTIDGGSPVTVTNGATGANYRVTLTGLRKSVHTIVCSTQSADNVMIIIGCATYPTAAARTAGIGYGHVGVGGGAIYQLKNLNVGIQDYMRQWSGWSGGANPETGYGFPTGPSLAIIEFGINDLGLPTSPLGFGAGMRRLIQAIRRGVPGASILILGALNADFTHSDVTSSLFNYSSSWHLFLAEMQRLAVTYRCAFLNIHAKWGDTPVAQGFASANNSHPTAAGHADIATTLLGVL